jgi:predicted HAD superfamily Cof-like phosphohydrolase
MNKRLNDLIYQATNIYSSLNNEMDMVKAENERMRQALNKIASCPTVQYDEIGLLDEMNNMWYIAKSALAEKDGNNGPTT